MTQENILYAILPVTSFSINYNKTHNSLLQYEIKYDLYKIGQRIQKPKICTFEVLKVFFKKT